MMEIYDVVSERLSLWARLFVTVGLLVAFVAPAQAADDAVFIDPDGNMKISGTVHAERFVGNGTIPIGGIIMWSGSVPPPGWSLCDGKTKLQTCRTSSISFRVILTNIRGGIRGGIVRSRGDSRVRR